MDSELDDLFSFLRFASVSTDSAYNKDVRACAGWLVEKFERMGLTSELHETARHPIVLARSERDPAKKTLLIYGHYDVQPVDPLELWDSPPFEPEVRDGRIWARGATDNKGQIMAHILGVEQTLKEDGELPVNVIFLVEGEEEIGSEGLVPFLENYKEELACDVIAVSDTSMVAPGTPTLGYGLRGITSYEVFLTGPSGDLHSGFYGGVVANPATAIAQLIASLHDKDGKVAIEGFYADVLPLEKWEHAMWADVPGYDDEGICKNTGSPSVSGEKGFSNAERLWVRPTAEVNGIGGGYQGEGSKTVLPAKAMAKLSFRLVPNQDPYDIEKKVIAHLEKHCPKGVKMEIKSGHHGKPYLCDPHSENGKAAQVALEKTFGKKPVLIREGGSIPIIQDMKEILGVDSLMLGLALPDCQIHAPNENFYVENFQAGIRMSRTLLKELG